MPCCGDGNLDPGEECDDGNLKDGDNCSSKCIWTGGSTTALAGTIYYTGKVQKDDKVWVLAYAKLPTSPKDQGVKADHVYNVEVTKFPLPYNMPVKGGKWYVAVVYDLLGDGEAGFSQEDFFAFYKVGGVAVAVEVADSQTVDGIDVTLVQP